MKIIVFGGDGFIGSYFVQYAVSAGHEVTVFDRFPFGESRNLEHLRDKIKLFSGEFSNRDDVERALNNQEIAYHCISATNPASSWNDPFIEIDENVRYSLQLFELAARQGVGKIVFFSSGGTVYGKCNGVINEDSPQRPFSPYGIGKLTIEHFLHYYAEHNGIEAIIYRIGNVFGPRQPMNSPQGVIAVWMNLILKGQELMIYGDSSTVRDYIYVGDVARLIGKSLDPSEGTGTYNIGSGRGVSITELLEMFNKIIDMKLSYRLLPRRSFDNESVILDSNRLLSRCPNFIFSNLDEKLEETWQYVKKNNFETK